MEKIRIPRKLKKAIKECVEYYDGYMLNPPKNKKTNKWHNKAIAYYHLDGHDYYAERWDDSEDGFKPTRRGDLIDAVIHKFVHIYWKPKLKWYRQNGMIFTYCINGIVYPNGAWVPKVKPADYIIRGSNYISSEYFIERSEYDYSILNRKVVERYDISKEEYECTVSTFELLELARKENRPNKA